MEYGDQLNYDMEVVSSHCVLAPWAPSSPSMFWIPACESFDIFTFRLTYEKRTLGSGQCSTRQFLTPCFKQELMPVSSIRVTLHCRGLQICCLITGHSAAETPTNGESAKRFFSRQATFSAFFSSSQKGYSLPPVSASTQVLLWLGHGVLSHLLIMRRLLRNGDFTAFALHTPPGPHTWEMRPGLHIVHGGAFYDTIRDNRGNFVSRGGRNGNPHTAALSPHSTQRSER